MKKINPEPSQSGAMQCIEDDCPECVEDTAIDEARQVKYQRWLAGQRESDRVAKIRFEERIEDDEMSA